ncbi:RYR2 protein, partial [Polypterus senegalus]
MNCGDILESSPLVKRVVDSPSGFPVENEDQQLRHLAAETSINPSIHPSSKPAPPKQDDEVVLQCSATIHKEQQKLCLAAEGFGNRLCFLESTSNSKNVPPDLSICTFVLEQSLSVRALQEMLANTEEKAEGVGVQNRTDLLVTKMGALRESGGSDVISRAGTESGVIGPGNASDVILWLRKQIWRHWPGAGSDVIIK